VHDPAEKRTSRQNYRGGVDVTDRCPDAIAAITTYEQIFDCCLQNVYAMSGYFGSNGGCVKFTICLRAWPLHGRSPAAIEQSELDACCVGRPTHDAIEGIDFANHMSFTETADRGVAAHLPDIAG
jgi:hypothetical protein